MGILDKSKGPRKGTRSSTTGSSDLPEPDPGPTVAEAASESVLTPHTRIHTVAEGETLAGIAEKYAVDPADVARLNAIGERDRVVEGQVFTIPAG